MELARRDGFQHNRKLRNGGAYDTKAVVEIVTEALKALTTSNTTAAVVAATAAPIVAGAGAPSA